MKHGVRDPKNLLFSKYLNLYEKVYFESPDAFKKEVDLITRFFSKNSQYIIDIGCGTGKHAVELIKLGYSVHCIDISPEAISATKNNIAKYPSGSSELSNIIYYETNKKYDAAIALFMVFSYMSRIDFQKAVKNTYDLLNPGGIFLFDVANGVQINNNFEHTLNITGKNSKIEWIRENKKDEQILEAEAKIESNGVVHYDYQTFRYYYPDEIANILKSTGFDRVDVYSDYHGEKDYKRQRSKLCVVCQKNLI